MKRCTRCGEERPHTDFYPAKGPKANKDGLRPRCKDCTKKLALEDYYRKGPKDPERNREAVRRFHERNPGKHAEYSRKWREKNGERAKELAYARHRKFRETKPERHIASQLKRRAQIGELTQADVEYIAILRKDPCSYCGGPAKPVDHIEPLRHGGSSDWTNLTASCQRCNTSKGAKPLLSFLLRAAQQS